MPLEAEPLPAEAAALIALWIDLGAPFAEPHAEHTSSVIDMLARSHSFPSGVFTRVQPTLEAKCLKCHGRQVQTSRVGSVDPRETASGQRRTP